MNVAINIIEVLALLTSVIVLVSFFWIISSFLKKWDRTKPFEKEMNIYLKSIFNRKEFNISCNKIAILLILSSFVMGAYVFSSIDKINSKVYQIIDYQAGCVTLVKKEGDLIVPLSIENEKEEMEDSYVYLSCRHKGKEDLRGILYDKKPKRVIL
jgi:hypothetical protein